MPNVRTGRRRRRREGPRVVFTTSSRETGAHAIRVCVCPGDATVRRRYRNTPKSPSPRRVYDVRDPRRHRTRDATRHTQTCDVLYPASSTTTFSSRSTALGALRRRFPDYGRAVQRFHEGLVFNYFYFYFFSSLTVFSKVHRRPRRDIRYKR